MATEIEERMECWCQLVYTHDSKPPVTVSKEKFTFGRAQDCDLSFISCKFLSGHHCTITRDKEGKVWLHDTSSNGTLVNGMKVKNGQRVLLNHNDQIQLVHRKDLDIGFLYQDLKHLQDEAALLDNTEEYDLDDDARTPLLAAKSSYHEEKEQENETHPGKRPHEQCASTSDPDGPTPKRQHADKDKEGQSYSEVMKDEEGQSSEVMDEPKDKEGQSSEVMDKPKDKERQSSEAATKPKLESHNSMAETLLCSICQDIFHDCVSLQPCMHSFCASCYSQWMERSNECPSCRNSVVRINKNHIVNNLVEAFLKEHPESRRSEEELKEMDAKNKITSDMLKPPRRRHVLGGWPLFGAFLDDGDEEDEAELTDYESDSTSSTDSHDDDDDDDDEFYDTTSGILASGCPFAMSSLPTSLGNLFGFSSIRDFPRAPPSMCRQCPSYLPPASADSPKATADSSKTVGPSCSGTDAASRSSGTTPPPYVCPLSRTHVLCLCCMQYMPDRRTEHAAATATPIPPQTCSVCHRAFCHMYWGCRGSGCLGCLNQFKDMNFGEKCLPTLINNNTCESTILKDYLAEKGITLAEMQRKCLEKLDSKEYQSVDSVSHNLTSSTVVCYKCGLRNFQDLAYQYRRNIPPGQLPASVTSKGDCYWGKNCRTQKNKLHHARRFNHICEQKRFT